MRDVLLATFRRVGDNLELYATLIVSGLLITLDFLSVTDTHWISTAILSTLFLLAIGNLRDRAAEKDLQRSISSLEHSVDRIASTSNDDQRLRWYLRRSDATPDMLVDMERYQHLVFLGVSHRKLPDYLGDVVTSAASPLPWVSIEIYFASVILGETYEGKEFHSNLMNARQEIAGILTDPIYADRLPQLRCVSFFQHRRFATHTGSMFGRSPAEFAVVYAVHSAVHSSGDTLQGLTIRLSGCPGISSPDARFQHYESIHRALLPSANKLGAFGRTLWDSSAQHWDEYARQSSVLKRSATVLADMIAPKGGDVILELASASGSTAQVILDRHPEAAAVLLDASPQMLQLSRKRFGNDPRVRLALCQLPCFDKSDFDLRDDKYSLIVIHQSLCELMKAFESIDDLASWCRDRLLVGGQVLVSAHNKCVRLPTPSEFSGWKDPFRATLLMRLKKCGVRLRQDTQPMFDEGEITAAFGRQGFSVAERQQEIIELNYEERRLLWHVPAVMASIIDGAANRIEQVGSLVDEVAGSLKGLRTMPRTVVFWRFTVP